MIEVVTPDIAFLYRDKLDSMHRLRHRVFSEHLGWDVNSRDGKERDVYDLLRPVYLLSTDAGGRVVGSMRLLPTTGPYMLRDVFPQLLEGADAPSEPFTWELSRFVVDPEIMAAERSGTVNRVTAELFVAMAEWCLMFGIKDVVAVYDVRMARLINRIAIKPRWVSQRQRVGSTIAMAGCVQMTDKAVADCRAASNLHEPVLDERIHTELSNAA